MKKLFVLLLLSLVCIFALTACVGDTPDLDAITFEDVQFEYDGGEKSIEAKNIPEGITVTYEGNGVSDVGTHTVTAYFEYEDGRDEEIEPMVATITIVKATYTPEFNGLSVDYDGKYHSVSIKGKLPLGVTASFENNKHKMPGTYTVEVSFTYDAKCYNAIASRSLSMKISAGNYSLSSLTYSKRADETIQITGYAGTAPDVVIPERIDGVFVTSIATDAFRDNKSVTYIYLPETVTNIGNSAFRGSTLSDIELPKNLQVIGTSAFAGTNIKSIALPDKLMSLGFGAFSDTQLEYIKLPFIGGSHTTTNDFVGYIFGATSYFTNGRYLPFTLKEIELSDECRKIHAYSFYGCESIEKITIGKAVSSIGNNAFSGCTELKSIYIPATVEDIYADENAYDSPFYKAATDLKIVFGHANSDAFGQYFSHISDTQCATVVFGKTYTQYLSLYAS